jgi:HK97 family phage major capsid protein
MSGLVSAKELRGKRATLAARMKEITDKPLGENGTLNAEQRQEFDRIDAAVNAMKADIDRLERAESLEAEMAQSRGTVAGGREQPAVTDEARKEAHKRAFDGYLRRGVAGISGEERATLEEYRAQGTNVDTAGGYLAPDEFRPVVERALLQFGGMRQARCTVISTSNGNDLWIPVSDDTSNSGVLVGENNAHTTQDMSFGQKKLGAYLYSSKIIKVSRQLLQDSAVDVVSLIGQAFGERLGRAQNADLTTGSGASKPYGLAATSTEGVAAATGQSASIIYNDFVDLEHSVDPAYRANAQWMFRDSSLKIIKKLKDGEGRPLWQPGLAVKSPDTILGYGYVINQDVAAMAASAKSVFFGDFSKYWIRDVQGMIVLRLDERYADNLQVGFLAFSRVDGNLIDAGTRPIKHYTNSAS